MEITITLWQLTGIVIGSVVGIATIISVLVASGIRIGKFATRDDLDRTSEQLEKKITVESERLEKKIDRNNESEWCLRQYKILATVLRLRYWSIRTIKMA